jgi:hypothetical protein
MADSREIGSQKDARSDHAKICPLVAETASGLFDNMESET